MESCQIGVRSLVSDVGAGNNGALYSATAGQLWHKQHLASLGILAIENQLVLTINLLELILKNSAIKKRKVFLIKIMYNNI